MAIEETNPRRVRVLRERVLKFGWFPNDERTLWFVLAFFGGMIVLLASIPLGAWLLGLALWIVMILIWATAIMFRPFEEMQTSVMAKTYRRGVHETRSVLGSNEFDADQPETGEVFGVDTIPAKRRKVAYIRPLGRVDFIPHETENGGVLGIAQDNTYRTHVGSMWMESASLLNVDQDDLNAQNAGFARLLGNIASTGSAIHRLAWREQTFPGEYVDPELLVGTIRKGANLTREDPPGQDVFRRNMANMGERSVVHRTTMSIAIYNNYVSRAERKAGGEEGVLVRALKDFYASVNPGIASPIGVKAAGFHSYNDLIMENRLALDPVFMWPIWNEWAKPAASDYLDPQDAWPGFADFKSSPKHCWLGDTCHMGFYFSTITTETGMPPDGFWNVLKVKVPKTVTVVFEMLPPKRGEYISQLQTGAAEGALEDKEFVHRRRTEADVQAERTAREHEREIATARERVGRVRAYVDLWGSNPEIVAANADRLRYAWLDAGFMLYPLTGRQHRGISAVMPLARGLASFPMPKNL